MVSIHREEEIQEPITQKDRFVGAICMVLFGKSRRYEGKIACIGALYFAL